MSSETETHQTWRTRRNSVVETLAGATFEAWQKAQTSRETRWRRSFDSTRDNGFLVAVTPRASRGRIKNFRQENGVVEIDLIRARFDQLMPSMRDAFFEVAGQLVDVLASRINREGKVGLDDQQDIADKLESYLRDPNMESGMRFFFGDDAGQLSGRMLVAAASDALSKYGLGPDPAMKSQSEVKVSLSGVANTLG